MVQAAEPLQPGFRRSPYFDEQVREEWHEGCRHFFNLPANFDPNKTTRLVIFATPNGNTIEQTLGCEKADGLVFNFDIQHVAAQIRRLRELTPNENVAIVVTQANLLSWPTFRSTYKDNPERIRKLYDGMLARIPGKDVRVTITGHSGGGSFLAGFLNGHDAIPAQVERIAYLDSNYSYSDDEKHGDKFLAWLKNKDHRLIVIAYDDREITLNGKKVVGPTGGTWRATDRMINRFSRDMRLDESKNGDFQVYKGLDGRILMERHTNPQNKILHTALVGEMNGLLEALCVGRDVKWGTFPSARAYTKWVQPAPGIEPRKAKMSAGAQLAKDMKDLPKSVREERISAELLYGNVPEFLRKFVTVTVKRKDKAGKEHMLSFDVMPDYLSLGTDQDFLRMPMTPQTATQVAESFGCVLPTKLMVDLIHDAATVKLEPKPLGEPREKVEQFANHHRIIEEQLKNHKRGDLVSGIKKDIIHTNRIFEKPHRVAIYGWHQLDGKPIQPVTIVHVDTYVDYSHGVRLVKRTATLDGKPKDVREIYRDPNLAQLLSDEGVLTHPGYE
jgi:hypothetical protein